VTAKSYVTRTKQKSYNSYLHQNGPSCAILVTEVQQVNDEYCNVIINSVGYGQDCQVSTQPPTLSGMGTSSELQGSVADWGGGMSACCTADPAFADLNLLCSYIQL